MPVECVGKDAIRNVVEYLVSANFHVTIISSDVSDNTVTGTSQSVSDHERAIGTERTVGSYSAEVRDGKISAYQGMPDVTDAQTAELVAHSVAHSVAFELGPGRDADQTPGSASLMGYGSKTSVLVTVTPGAEGVPQPIHIHEGSCASLGAAAFALQDVRGGKSGTVLDVAMDDLQTGNHAINVHRSEDEPDVYVACGDIPAPAPAPPPVEPAPAPEVVIAPAPAEVAAPVTGSGGLLGEEGSGRAAWWYGLVVGGALLVLGGLAGVRKAPRER